MPGFIAILLGIGVAFLNFNHLVKSNPSLAKHSSIVCLCGCLYLFVVAYRILQIEDMLAWTDGAGHHLLGILAGEMISSNGLLEVAFSTRPGNPFYQFLTGCIYSIGGPYPEVIFVCSAVLGYLAMTLVLDALTRVNPDIPVWSVFFVIFLPSAVFWTPFNLKEGPMLWSIAVLLHSSSLLKGEKLPMIRILIATAIGILLRPHIILCWLVGIAFARIFLKFNLRVAVLFLIAIAPSIYLTDFLLPGLISNFGETISESADASARHAVSHGGSAVSGRSIPFLTGGLLLLARPYPWEIFSLSSLVTSVEIWTFTILGTIGWLGSHDKLRLIRQPLVMTSLIALLCLFLPFSFFYNMGLLARQRLQAFPAILVLAVLPFGYKISETIRLSGSLHFHGKRVRIENPDI